ncbi:MAG: ABC transporter ATP-binding protein [Phycisphaeraceae bacterium]|nr:ABC transporter ATP-binding protein [Phycisphaeraceae bacterium]
MKPFWAFARQMLRYRAKLALGMTCAVLSGLGLGVGLLAAYPVLDNVLGNGHDLPTMAQSLNQGGHLPVAIPQWVVNVLPSGRYLAIVIIVVAMALLTLFSETVAFLHQWLSIQVVHRTIADIRRRAFHRVIRLPLKDVVASGTNDAISRIVNDSAQLAGGFTALMSKAVAQTAKGVAALGAALLFHWKLTLIAMVVAPVLAFVIRSVGQTVRRASRRALESQADLYASAGEAMRGLRVVKVYTAERYECGRFHRINKEATRQTLKARTYRVLSSPLNEAMALLALGSIVIVASRFILEGTIGTTTFLLTMGALFIAAASLRPLAGVISELQASEPAAERLAELLEMKPEPGHDFRLPRLERHRDSIEFDGVSLTYPGQDEPALRDVSLRVEHGERIAVVGPNGSGKTTLLSLVPRLFEPDSGRVLIDGRDITEVSVRSLRRQIGVVTQETVMFRASIRDNIAYGGGGASEEEIVQAAKRARAHEFITRIPGGYDAMVGEQGATLSGGQRQRIAIARAILRDPSILILDEATSMIDADSEAKIAEAMSEFSLGRTCLIVAHRLSTVLGADRIVVMDQGAIVDSGRHEDLLDRCDAYRLIAQHQLVSLA